MKTLCVHSHQLAVSAQAHLRSKFSASRGRSQNKIIDAGRQAMKTLCVHSHQLAVLAQAHLRSKFSAQRGTSQNRPSVKGVVMMALMPLVRLKILKARHSRASGNPPAPWTPACAGVTQEQGL